jgi:hypothetical protein
VSSFSAAGSQRDQRTSIKYAPTELVNQIVGLQQELNKTILERD